MINAFLRGNAGPQKDGYLRPEHYPNRIDGFLLGNNGPQNDGYLRPGRYAFEVLAEIAAFPTQFAGLRYFLGTVKELCLVALGDAPAGDQWRIRKNATDYAVYLVDTTDPNASQVRVQTSAGLKAARLKT
jgi:hypothetical protein